MLHLPLHTRSLRRRRAAAVICWGLAVGAGVALVVYLVLHPAID